MYDRRLVSLYTVVLCALWMSLSYGAGLEGRPAALLTTRFVSPLTTLSTAGLICVQVPLGLEQVALRYSPPLNFL